MKNKYKVGLLLILFVAIALRLTFIGSHSLWVDELFSLKFASLDLVGLIRETVDFDNHPPLYYILLHYWIAIFGTDEVALRSLSVIFSSLTVYLTFKLGRLIFDERTALLGAMLVTLSVFSIYYAQEARMYSLLAFTSVLSTYFFVRCMNERSNLMVFYYVFSTILLLYTHSYGIFFVIAQNVYFLLLIFISKKQGGSLLTFLQWIRIQFIVFLFSLPWLYMLLGRFSSLQQEGFWVERPGIHSFIETFMTLSGSYSGVIVWLSFIALAVISIYFVAKPLGKFYLDPKLGQTDFQGVVLLIVLLLVPLIVPFIVSQFSTPIYVIRSTIVVHFAFCLLVARGVTLFRWRIVQIVSVFILLSLSLKAILKNDDYVRGDMPQVKGVVEYFMVSDIVPKTIVLCGDSHLFWPFTYYAEKFQLPSSIIKASDEMGMPDKKLNKFFFIRMEKRARYCENIPKLLSRQYTKIIISNPKFTGLEVFYYNEIK